MDGASGPKYLLKHRSTTRPVSTLRQTGRNVRWLRQVLSPG